MTHWLTLSENIRYRKFTVSPLSAEIGLIEGDRYFWLFDVGASPEALSALKALDKPCCAVLSHFHPDHMANWDKLALAALYQGSYTFTKTKTGTAVREPLTIEDGVHLKLFPLPSGHAKGCIGLEVNETYAFVGDAAYSTAKNGRIFYNTTLLKDTIDTLRDLKAPWFLLSHADPFVQKKEDVLTMLKGIYAQRTPNCPHIFPR